MTKGRLTVLKLEIRPGESISIGNYAVVTLEEKSGKIARLAIQADSADPAQIRKKADKAAIEAAKEFVTEMKAHDEAEEPHDLTRPEHEE